MTAVVSIFGRLAADARVSTMHNGGAVFNFRVASNARAKRDGQWTDVTTWWSVTLFVGDRQVDYYSRSLVKGAQVYLSGQTHQDTYINSSGEEKTSMMVIANVVNTAYTGQSGQSGGHDQGGYSRQSQQRQTQQRQQHTSTSAPPEYMGGDFDDDIPF